MWATRQAVGSPSQSTAQKPSATTSVFPLPSSRRPFYIANIRQRTPYFVTRKWFSSVNVSYIILSLLRYKLIYLRFYNGIVILIRKYNTYGPFGSIGLAQRAEFVLDSAPPCVMLKVARHPSLFA
jgi:hypothetical protein